MNLKTVSSQLQILTRKQIKERNLSFKIETTVIQIISKVMKEVTLSEKDIENMQWESFETFVKENEFYRILSKLNLSEEEKLSLVDYLDDDTGEQSSSLPNTPVVDTVPTTASSTTAPVITAVAPAPECPVSLSDGNPLATLFGPALSEETGRTISQTVLLRNLDKLYTAKLDTRSSSRRCFHSTRSRGSTKVGGGSMLPRESPV